jgi:hypothetical protein
MLEFLKTYSQFYKDHRHLYRNNHYATEAVRVSAANVSVSLLSNGTRTIHLVNHNYNRGIVAQNGVTVAVDLPSCPRRVTLVSPDADKTSTSTCRRGKLSVTVDRLDYYSVLVLG